jgi:KUP system potassium uptake protein
VPRALALAEAQGLRVPAFESSYFLSRETVVPPVGPWWRTARERLYALMSRNAGGVAGFFRLPPGSVVELGSRVQL